MQHAQGRRLIERLGMQYEIPDISRFDRHEENHRITRLEITVDSILESYKGEYPSITVYRRHWIEIPFRGRRVELIPAKKRFGTSKRYFDEAVVAFRHEFGICEVHKTIEEMAYVPDGQGDSKQYYASRIDTLIRGSRFMIDLLRQNHKEEIWYSTMIAARTTSKDYEKYLRDAQ